MVRAARPLDASRAFAVRSSIRSARSVLSIRVASIASTGRSLPAQVVVETGFSPGSGSAIRESTRGARGWRIIALKGALMNGLEVTVLLGITVLTGAILAPRFRVAMPLLLLVAGLALGFIPEVREIVLPPETVLLLFLPVLLFWESMTTSLRSIRRDFRGIFLKI